MRNLTVSILQYQEKQKKLPENYGEAEHQPLIEELNK
jgi:hypothetical protein